MIRWCSYCQRFLGEIAPFDQPTFTHCICEPCVAKLERDEPLIEQTQLVRDLVRRLIAAARNRDGLACDAILAEAGSVPGIEQESLLVGMLQPALYQAGLDWQAGGMTVAAEHYLTSWCERVLLSVPAAPPTRPLDLVIFQTPGNAHSLGPRLAGRVLAVRGFSVEVFVPELPLAETVHLVRELRPRWVGFSCALPSAETTAREIITSLRGQLEPELCCRYAISGFSSRFGGSRSALEDDGGITVVRDVDAFAGVMSKCTP